MSETPHFGVSDSVISMSVHWSGGGSRRMRAAVGASDVRQPARRACLGLRAPLLTGRSGIRQVSGGMPLEAWGCRLAECGDVPPEPTRKCPLPSAMPATTPRCGFLIYRHDSTTYADSPEVICPVGRRQANVGYHCFLQDQASGAAPGRVAPHEPQGTLPLAVASGVPGPHGDFLMAMDSTGPSGRPVGTSASTAITESYFGAGRADPSGGPYGAGTTNGE